MIAKEELANHEFLNVLAEILAEALFNEYENKEEVIENGND